MAENLLEINVVIRDNPFGVRGSVNKNEDGSYTIFINAHLNTEQQHEVYEHEVRHILNGDFDKYNCDKIECAAHMMSEGSSELCPAL
ncbi:hypothetical protein AC844P1_00036 [Anaerostipes phage AC844P1]|nr:hypothetical protein AC844P1_00036 [Anaerostipes phage AC844P1]WAX05306.1 hypothetical protein AC844P2_00036 [Anaerostipes phage AC844P2]WAX05365.1 hypothetical protein AC844P3_00036 [Anaerostipes phage AC844P3]